MPLGVVLKSNLNLWFFVSSAKPIWHFIPWCNARSLCKSFGKMD